MKGMTVFGEDLLKGAKEFSEHTGGKVSPAQVYHMVEREQVPFIKIGKTLYFRKSEIEAVFSAQPNEAAANG